MNTLFTATCLRKAKILGRKKKQKFKIKWKILWRFRRMIGGGGENVCDRSQPSTGTQLPASKQQGQ
jgi:hypothetical protein